VALTPSSLVDKYGHFPETKRETGRRSIRKGRKRIIGRISCRQRVITNPWCFSPKLRYIISRNAEISTYRYQYLAPANTVMRLETLQTSGNFSNSPANL